MPTPRKRSKASTPALRKHRLAPAALTSRLDRVGSRQTLIGLIEDEHGQARELSRHGLLLRDQEESAQSDREARIQEIRSGRAQARRIQGSQDQVAGTAA